MVARYRADRSALIERSPRGRPAPDRLTRGQLQKSGVTAEAAVVVATPALETSSIL